MWCYFNDLYISCNAMGSAASTANVDIKKEPARRSGWAINSVDDESLMVT